MSANLCRSAVRAAGGARAMSGIQPQSATAGGHGGGMALWKKLSFFVAFPAIGLGMANVIMFHEHEDRPEFIPYDYLRIRTKRFPWGDGNHSLFHNPEVNALPTGYETEAPKHH